MASEDDRKQKTFYPEADTADWITETARQNDRSESYVVSKMLEEIAESVNSEPIMLSNHTFKAEKKE